MTLLHRLLETTTVVVSVVADDACAIVEANPAFAHHVGVALERLPGRSLEEFVAIHEREPLAAWCAGAATPPVSRTPISFVTVNGAPYTLHCLAQRQEHRLWLVGEPELEVEGGAAVELVQLNNEMATLARENSRRRRELERTQVELAAALNELQTSYWHLQKIQEVLPLCMRCGRVKTDEARWDTFVDYLRSNEIFLSHGYCPECASHAMREFGLEPGG